MLQRTFDFLCLTEGGGGTKKWRTFLLQKKNRARRVVEVRLRRFAVQTRQRLGQWPVSRVEDLHRRVGRRDSSSNSHWFGLKNEST